MLLNEDLTYIWNDCELSVLKEVIGLEKSVSEALKVIKNLVTLKKI